MVISYLYSRNIEDKFIFSSLTKVFQNEFPDTQEIVILCIGIDRSTGDCFGPLTGTLLKQMRVTNVLGTLEKPVHAQNIETVCREIKKNSYVVAIDSALGSFKQIGCVTVKKSHLFPGKAMNRNLPAVGDMSITLNVNINGIHNYLLLQNSSLNLVWKGANIVAKSIFTAFSIRKKHDASSARAAPN